MKVWPVQAGVPKPVPVVVPAVFCWSSCGAFESITSPGLVVRSSAADGTPPARKSVCVVSVRQALVGAAVKEKFCVVVPPSVTTMLEADAVTNPGLLAVSDGYVPAGLPGTKQV